MDSDADGHAKYEAHMPAGIALLQHRPAHGQVLMTGLDGERRCLSITAVPLFASATEVVGMIALFWETAPGGA